MTFMKLKSERDIELHSLKTIKIIVSNNDFEPIKTKLYLITTFIDSTNFNYFLF